MSDYKIAIVDDDLLMTEIIREHLEMAGFTRVKTYSEPHVLLSEMSRGEYVDIVVTDFNMPEMNGVELLKKAFTINSSVRGFIFSGMPQQVREFDNSYPVVDKEPHFELKILSLIKEMEAETLAP